MVARSVGGSTTLYPRARSTQRMSRHCLCGTARCGTGGFAKLVTGNVENGKAPPPFWEGLEISLDKNLDRLFAGVNLNTNRPIAKVYLVASSLLSSNDGVGHCYIWPENFKSRPKPHSYLCARSAGL